MRILPLAEAKARLSRLVADLETSDEEIAITRNGRATAVLIGYEAFERWKETTEILSDRRLLAEVRRGMASLKRGRAKVFRTRDLDRLFNDGR